MGHGFESDMPLSLARRQFFRDCGVGVGKIALASLLADGGVRAAKADSESVHAALHGPPVIRTTHFAPKAKRVIYMFMAGAPSQLDLFDNKPALLKYDGKPVPAEESTTNPGRSSASLPKP